MKHEAPRTTYALIDALEFRTRAASTLIGVSDITLRTYSEKSGITIPRANKGVPVRLYDIYTLFQLTDWRRKTGSVKLPKKGAKPVFITVDVVKGGTGKTTTAVETAIHLQFLGLRVLAIDLDVQANLTQCFGYQDDFLPEDLEQQGLSEEALITNTFASIVRPFLENRRASRGMPEISGLIKKPFGEYGPHCIGSDTYLGDIEKDLSVSTGARELAFASLFEHSINGATPGFDLNNYDVVIMDCPPNMSLTSTAALAAADIVIAPVRMDSFAVKGLARLIGEMNNLNRDYKIKPELIILPTHYSPQFGRTARMQQAVNSYADSLAPQVISLSEEFPKANENFLPLSLQKPTSNGAKEYQVFAEYLHAKILQTANGKGTKKG